MPALTFGLKPSKPGPPRPSAPQKRKAAFEETTAKEDNDDVEDAFTSLSARKTQPRPHKSPKLNHESDNSNTSTSANNGNRYGNLSALRSAKLHDEAASKLDASVYDYDGVYETFNMQKNNDSSSNDTTANAVPKYMTNLLASAEVRKRDQLRAREKALQKERDAEGDEFADKERFVTSAYKAQQEELRRIEEEERRREEVEDEKRRKGEGMRAFHADLLRKDEERSRAVEDALAMATQQEQQQQQTNDETHDTVDGEEKTETKLAADLNSAGANIIVNDDGEIVDKRQLLSAGLNVAPKKGGADADRKRKAAEASSLRPQEWQQRSAKAQDARAAQRERQSRMMERQIEEMEAKAKEAEAAEKKELEEKNKTRLTEGDRLSAKERYLQRKREREEEEAKKAKAKEKD